MALILAVLILPRIKSFLIIAELKMHPLLELPVYTLLPHFLAKPLHQFLTLPLNKAKFPNPNTQRHCLPPQNLIPNLSNSLPYTSVLLIHHSHSLLQRIHSLFLTLFFFLLIFSDNILLF